MVYFIQGAKTGLIKIGQTIKVVQRVRTLQAESPDRLTVLAVLKNKIDDHPYHAKFATSWSHGEWFYPTPDLLAFIATIPKSQYDGLCIRARNPRLAVASGMAETDWNERVTSQRALDAIAFPEEFPNLCRPSSAEN